LQAISHDNANQSDLTLPCGAAVNATGAVVVYNALAGARELTGRRSKAEA
jgi:hypothetical protein